MSLRKICTAIALSIALTACATAPRGPAGKIGTAGTNLATALSAHTDKIAKDVAMDPAFSTFIRVYTPCKEQYARTPNLKKCTLAQPQGSAALAAQFTREYDKTLRLEGSAFRALAGAYTAFKTESDYDAAGASLEAISGAAKAVDTLAKAVLPALAPVPIEQIAKRAAGAAGARRQERRLKIANEQLSAITQRLSEAMQAQHVDILDTLKTSKAIARRRCKLLLPKAWSAAATFSRKY